LLLDKNGRLWVTDFGLAHLLSSAPSEEVAGSGQAEATAGPPAHAQADDLAGTLRYMAPERLCGHLDARCDIYALGMTLYELATLRPAFEEPDRARLIQRITTTPPPAPRTVNPAVPGDFEAIILKAIAASPDARYQTASEMLRDLLHFMNGRPVLARKRGIGHWVARWWGRG